jgi:hypothetical protein
MARLILALGLVTTVAAQFYGRPPKVHFQIDLCENSSMLIIEMRRTNNGIKR